MASFLERVCDDTRARVSAARGKEPLDQLRSRALAAPPPPDFAAALRTPPAIIAELKRSSPSRGALATVIDPVARARAYADGGAAAISVLTEPSYFNGSVEDLATVATAVDIPVLRKDFVIDPYQVWEARAAGAAAVLVIVAALSQAELSDVLAATVEAGVGALIETHTGEETTRALDAAAAIEGLEPILGVNTRDMRDLRVDPAVFPAIRDIVPPGWTVVAESGVTGPDDVSRYRAQGADAVLIGEYVMTAEDPAAAVKELVSAARAVKPSPGHYGRFGGRFVPEALVNALDELEQAFEKTRVDPAFTGRLEQLSADYGGRPTPLYFAERLTGHAGGAAIYLKREDLAHTGSHKLCNVLGQGLLAQRMGKRRLIAETGAGQHGVATATIAALLGLECRVYMGEEDCRRQRLNVVRMQLMGAEVVPVTTGTRTLKDAINETMRDWVTNVETTHYLLGSVVGPHPFPLIVREFVKVIGEEVRTQIQQRAGRLPDAVVACVGGGSNAMGLFHPFIADTGVRLIGVEAGGDGLDTGRHAATLTAGSEGILHGARSFVLQDRYGQVRPTHSVSAGLDYPGVGPEHAWLRDTGRATYRAATDAQALEGFRLLCELEGIIPALEPAHAIVPALELARELGPDGVVVVNLSGRGDKDVDEVIDVLGMVEEGGDE